MRPLVAPLALALGLVLVSTGCGATRSVARNPAFRHGPHRVFRHDGISFGYPAAWTPVSGCTEGTLATPFVALTSVKGTYTCTDTTSWFPRSLHQDAVMAVWVNGGAPGLSQDSPIDSSWTARVGGEPARTTLIRPGSARWRGTGCGQPRSRVALVTEIRPRGAKDNYFQMTACLRGPHVAADLKAVHGMLSSVRFAKYWR